MPFARSYLRKRMLSGDRRAGEWPRGKARREQYEFVRRNWPRLATLGAVPLIVIAVAAVFLPPFAAGMLLGAGITAVLGLLAFYVVQATGTAPIMAGDGAEQWTAQELRRLKRHGWRLINHFNLSAKGDIDHVLVGPFGALAVESKWSAQPLNYDDVAGPRLLNKVSQARANARRLEMWQPFHSRRIAVRPVVMLWGRGLSDWPDGTYGFLVDDVQVVAGPRAELWRRALPMEAVLTDEQVEAVWTAIDEQAERRDEHDRSESPVPPSPLALYMRALVTLAAFTAGLLLTGEFLQPPSWTGLAGCSGVMLIGALGLRHRTIRFVAGGLLAGVTAMLLLALVVLAVARTGVS